MRTLVLLALPLLACQAEGQGEMRGLEVVARDGRDRVTLVLRRTDVGCIADENLSIFAHSDGIRAGAWTLARGPTGRELNGPSGLLARVVDEPGPPRRLSIIDPVGVPMARLQFPPGGAPITVIDGARSLVGTIEPAGRGFQLIDALDGSTRGRVTGTTDAELAARLLVPLSIPDEARALFACGRLAVATPAVK